MSPVFSRLSTCPTPLISTNNTVHVRTPFFLFYWGLASGTFVGSDTVGPPFIQLFLGFGARKPLVPRNLAFEAHFLMAAWTGDFLSRESFAFNHSFTSWIWTELFVF